MIVNAVRSHEQGDQIMLDTLIIGAAGLTKLWDGILSNWITPIYLAAIAIGAFMFIRSQQLTKLIMFLVVAAIVGVLIFGGSVLFGNKGQAGSLTRMFTSTGEELGNANSSGLQN